VLILTLAFFWAGCSSPRDADAAKRRHFLTPVAGKAAVVQSRPPTPEPGTATNAPPRQPQIRYPQVLPRDVRQGRVAAVNPTLRFVVMDFALSPLPTLGQRVGVFRMDQRVGEIKVTGPFQGSSVVGDIIEGEPQVEDRLRVEQNQ
jgi:hypothetical protein